MTSETEEAVAREYLETLQNQTGIPHPPTQATYHLRRAVAGEGPRAHDWEDKPSRIVYDACREAERLEAALSASQAEVERLTRERDEANREARYLAIWLFDTYYRHLPDQPEITLLPDPAGVITQIDNMITGVRDRLLSAEARATRAEGLLEALANAADVVGVAYFDSDDLSPEVEAMQSATLAARAFLDKLKEQGQ